MFGLVFDCSFSSFVEEVSRGVVKPGVDENSQEEKEKKRGNLNNNEKRRGKRGHKARAARLRFENTRVGRRRK